MTLRPSAQAEVDRLVATALGQSEAGTPRVNVSDRSDSADNLGRWPCTGLHPGAIPGTLPHASRRIEHWNGR